MNASESRSLKAEGSGCRVCGSARISDAGRVEYLRGFDWPVLDCDECGCRWTQHDDTVHQRLHTTPAISYYAEYVALAEQARTAFAARDLQTLSSELRRWPKYRFVLDAVEREPRSSRILEVGCSRGYLTSHLILDGRNVLGIDVSDEAITAARSAFGDHFALVDSARAMAGRPYDLIYHVGMIGCVSDPIGLTQKLLSLVRPGGRLIFNAPNRAALHLRGQLWFDSAPPPDLVTLFPEGFWQKYLAREALVEETVEWLPADQSAQSRYSGDCSVRPGLRHRRCRWTVAARCGRRKNRPSHDGRVASFVEASRRSSTRSRSAGQPNSVCSSP